MSFLSSIFADTGRETVKGFFEGAGNFSVKIRQALTGEISPDQKAQLLKQAEEFDHALKNAQINVNMQEARHKSLFVAGWRPFLGWVCGFGVAYYSIGHPLLCWANKAFGWGIIDPPPINADQIMPIIYGMLGMGTLRQVDKSRGTG